MLLGQEGSLDWGIGREFMLSWSLPVYTKENGIAQTFKFQHKFKLGLFPRSCVPSWDIHVCPIPFPHPFHFLAFSACLLLCTSAPRRGAYAKHIPADMELGLTSSPPVTRTWARWVEPSLEKVAGLVGERFCTFLSGEAARNNQSLQST